MDDFVGAITSSLQQSDFDFPAELFARQLEDGLEAPKGSSIDVFMEFKHAKHTLANARLLARAARVMDVGNQTELRTLQLEEAIASKVALSVADKTELEAVRVLVSSVFAPTERMVFSNAVVTLAELSSTWTQARLFKIEFTGWREQRWRGRCDF